DGANATFYINGMPAGGGAIAAPPLAERDLQIGGMKATEFVQGTLDEVRIWSVARTQQQIQDNIHKEVRSGTGLVAAFGDGGMHEDLETLTGTVIGTGIGATHHGFLPKDLIVPLASTAPVFNGLVDPTVEYAGAEMMPMRFVRSDGALFTPGLDGLLEAHFLRTETDLYIGIPYAKLFAPIPPSGDPWLGETSKIALMLDLDYLRPELAQ